MPTKKEGTLVNTDVIKSNTTESRYWRYKCQEILAILNISVFQDMIEKATNLQTQEKKRCKESTITGNTTIF